MLVNRLKIIAVCVILLDIMGCASIKETARRFAGVSTRILEKGRTEAITKTFNFDCDTAVAKAKEALQLIEAYIYAQDDAKKMIAVYVSDKDTTPVGLFFTEVNKNTVRIEVSSPSTFGKEFISGKVFAFLEGKPLKKKAELANDGQ